MSDKEFELYLSLLSRFLRLKPDQRDEIADELRDHLEERLEELTGEGLSREKAIRRALDEFGDAADLASHFTQLARRRKRKLIMRITAGSIATLSAAMLVTFAFWPEVPAVNIPPRAIAQQAAPAEDDAQAFETMKETKPLTKEDRVAAIRAKLEKTDMSLEFPPDTPLNEVFEYIQDALEVTIWVHWERLEEDGISRDTPVSINISAGIVSNATAFELLLEPLELAYMIRDGLIYVTTILDAEENDRYLEVRVYNCRDLLEGVEERVVYHVIPKEINIQTHGGGGGQFTITDGEDFRKLIEKQNQLPAAIAVRQTPGDTLIKVIREASSGVWEEDDGSGGTISEFDGLLIVKQRQIIHEEIEQLLKMVRSVDAADPKPKKSAVQGGFGRGGRVRGQVDSGFRPRQPRVNVWEGLEGPISDDVIKMLIEWQSENNKSDNAANEDASDTQENR